MKQRLGAVARGLAVTALSGLLAAGGCISQRANESETTARSEAVRTSRMATINQSRAWYVIRGLRSNLTPKTRYLGPADPASSYRAGSINITAVNGQGTGSPSVATNLTEPVAGPAYYVGTATGTAVNAGVAGTNLTGTAIVPGPVAALGNTVVGGMAEGAGVIAGGDVTVATTSSSAGAKVSGTANSTVGGTGNTSAPATTTFIAGTVTSPGVAGPPPAQTFTATSPVGVAPSATSTAATGRTQVTGAGVAGTVTSPGVAGPVSTRTLTGSSTLGTGASTKVLSNTVTTSNATVNGTGGATAKVLLRPTATATTSIGERIKLGATPLAAARNASGRVVVTNQTIDQQ